MRVFLAIVGLLLLLSLGSQAVRHAYWRSIGAQRSVLDRFAEPTEQRIAESKTIEELIGLYEKAHAEVQEDKKLPHPAEEDEWERQQREPYKSEQLLKDAIEIWESHRRQIYEVQFLWWCGAIIVAIGHIVVRRVNWWLGISLLILGFVEMSYATSPPFPLGGSDGEFTRLLTYKLCYSAAAVAALLITWWYVWRLLPDWFPPQVQVAKN